MSDLSEDSYIKVNWKVIIIKIYVLYILGYYFISRLIFLILEITNHYELSFWMREIIFPLVYSGLCIITLLFIEKFYKIIDSVKFENYIKRQFYNSLYFKLIFLIALIISILLNIEGILGNRFQPYHYFDLLGPISFSLMHLEIWQTCFLLPIGYTLFASIVLSSLKIKKFCMRNKINIKKENIYEIQKLAMNSIQIFITFIGIYILLLLFNLTSENFIYVTLYVAFWFSVVIFSFHIFKSSYLYSRYHQSIIHVDISKGPSLLNELYEFCKSFKDWTHVIEILTSPEHLFIQFFKAVFTLNPIYTTFSNYFLQNSNKNIKKLKIIVYIISFFKFKGQYCIAQNVLSELSFPKATIYRNIQVLQQEGLIKKQKLESLKQEYLIPNNLNIPL